MDERAIDWLTELSLGALARGESPGPQVLTLLVRRYAATGRDDLRDAVGLALARALDAIDAGQDTPEGAFGTANEMPEWLTLFLEAASLSDDGRLRRAAADLTTRLRDAWPHDGEVGAAMRSLDACLRSLHVLDRSDLIPAAIDELERLVGRVYRPGKGVTRSASGAHPGELDDHTCASGALLTAYGVTGRLPYAMLADDLMLFARRSWWDGERGGYGEPAGLVDAPNRRWFVSNCEAARVLCRLAALHDDGEYRQGAVMTEDCDHTADAERILARLAPDLGQHGVAGAVYGLAVGELHGLRNLQ